MNQGDLKVFFAVVRTGSFADAARYLDIDPSVVSRSVARLEAHLTARLFERTTRRLSLTERGEMLAERAEPLVLEFEELAAQVRGRSQEPRGRFCLSVSVAFGQTCIVPLIPKFLARYPEISLDLKLTDQMSDLVADRVDLAVRLAPDVHGDLIVSKLMSTRYLVCVSPDYLGKHPQITRPQDLTDHQAVCFDLPGYQEKWLLRKDGAISEVAITPRLKTSNALAVRNMCLAGLGPALMADWLVEGDLRTGSLVNVFPDYEATATTFETAAWLVYPSRSFLPKNTRVMIDFLREKLA